MADSLPLALVLLWIAWLVQALLSAIQVYRFGSLYRRPIPYKYVVYQPRATIIVPVKGLDDDLPAHIEALCGQEYHDYQLVFVVESEDDPAHDELHRRLAHHSDCTWRVLVSGSADRRSGQKVHNQLAALKVLDEECQDDEAWVFADTDVVPSPQWLAMLVGPLWHTTRIGMTSGYRWLIPTPSGRNGRRPSVWSHLASVCNSSVACQFGRYRFNHAWGGSMAIRVDVARRGNLLAYLDGALTDDYQFTRMCRDLKLRIMFVPQCLVASTVQFDRARLCNFGHRQYLITHVYAPKLYLAALASTTLFVAGWMSAAIWLVACLVQRDTGNWRLPAIVMGVAFVLNQIRSTLRGWAIVQAFGQSMRKNMRTTLFMDRWLTTVWMTLHWLVVLRAALGRDMTWRGIRYRLHGRQQIERLE